MESGEIGVQPSMLQVGGRKIEQFCPKTKLMRGRLMAMDWYMKCYCGYNNFSRLG